MKDSKFDLKIFAGELVFTGPLFFILFIYIPLEIMCSNLDEYSCSILDMFGTGAVIFAGFFLLLSVLASCLNEKDRKLYNYIITGLTVGTYVQYMFMNGRIGSLNGYSYTFSDNIFLSIINICIWLIIVAAFIFAGIKFQKASDNMKYIPGIIGILVLVAVVSLVITNLNDFSVRRFKTFDYKDRYMLASEENVILFCFDSIDNRYFEELLAEDYDFSDFKDFSLYTNTCSVFDNTHYSMPQMVTASGATTNENYSEFYTRMKDNGFNIRFYSYESTPYNYVPVHNYVDNYLVVDEKSLSVDYYRLAANLCKMSGYVGAPYAIKSFFDVTDFEFLSQVKTDNYELGNQGIYPDNDVYLESLKLEKSNELDKSFVYEHLKGTHGGVDSVNVTKQCLSVAAEYIKQVKELGLYEDATIIFVSDHGRSDDIHIEDYPEASTPMFLIKGKNEKHDTMQLNDAPIYHKDILSTILVNTGLFNKATDYDLFGPSIYDFSSGDLRERAWYNQDPARNDVYYEYIYSGTEEELRKAVETGPTRTISYN